MDVTTSHTGLPDDSTEPPDDLPVKENNWAARNPTKEVQKSKAIRKLTEAERETRKINAAQNKAARTLLMQDIDAFLEEQDLKIGDIAEKHARKPEYIKRLIVPSSTHTTARAPTLPNAIAHMKSVEVNENLPPGEKIKLQELKNMANSDDAYRNLTEEDKTRLKEELQKYRALKRTGARPSNISASQDIRRITERVTKELDDLSERTGIYAFLFLTRSHVDDTAKPAWFGTAEADMFLREVLKKDPFDLMRLFEQWACARQKNRSDRDTLASVRKECTKLIITGLRTLTGSKTIEMNYANYDTAIVERYKVKLIGWTYEKFVNPSQIGTMTEICKLRDALKSGVCQWIRLGTAQVQAHSNTLQERRENGEIIGRPRRQRSDKGKSRKRKSISDSDMEDIPPVEMRLRNGKATGASGKRKRLAVQSAEESSSSNSDFE